MPPDFSSFLPFFFFATGIGFFSIYATPPDIHAWFSPPAISSRFAAAIFADYAFQRHSHHCRRRARRAMSARMLRRFFCLRVFRRDAFMLRCWYYARACRLLRRKSEHDMRASEDMPGALPARSGAMHARACLRHVCAALMLMSASVFALWCRRVFLMFRCLMIFSDTAFFRVFILSRCKHFIFAGLALTSSFYRRVLFVFEFHAGYLAACRRLSLRLFFLFLPPRQPPPPPRHAAAVLLWDVSSEADAAFRHFHWSLWGFISLVFYFIITSQVLRLMLWALRASFAFRLISMISCRLHNILYHHHYWCFHISALIFIAIFIIYIFISIFTRLPLLLGHHYVSH